MPSVRDVTIIIPAFCTTKDSLGWLDECLESASSQGCDVVLVDDGSLVNIDPVVSKYSVVTYLDGKVNRGASAARNLCVKFARTPLIFPLDCDDTLRDHAIEELLKKWEGIPVYPDIAKFGDEIEPHYALLNFDCSLITKYIGFSSVNVLHSVDQWKSVGGWDEKIDFYEDGEYNARLFSRYCAVRYPEPLVNYRIHKTQRTKLYSENVSHDYATKLLERIRRYDLMCTGCGSKRRTGSNDPSMSNKASRMGFAPTTRGPSQNVKLGNTTVNLPQEFGGRVLARYVGGQGKGKHYYKGLVSNEQYKVLYGQTVYADPRDVRSADQTANKSMLIRIEKPAPSTPVPETPAPEVKKVARTPRIVEPAKTPVPETKPVETPAPVRDSEELPEINMMSLEQIRGMELDQELAKRLYKSEEDGLGRKKVLSYLKSKISQ